MDWLEMHNVEFGECIVLGSKKGNILMVDCGSMNVKIRETEMEVSDYVTHTLMPRYQKAVDRSFLLTHFHRDHLSGLRQILKANPFYFSRIYLPATPVSARGRALLLEFAVYVFTFLNRQSEYSQMSVSALRVFERMRSTAGIEAVYTLGRGSCFYFEGVDYEVLWPALEDYPFSPLFADIVDELDVCLSSPFLGSCAPRFLELKRQFCAEYVNCCRMCTPEERAQLVEIEASIHRLSNYLGELEALSASLQRLPAAQDIAEILSRPAVRSEYSDAQNAASIVFHNRRIQATSYDDILMTGDATPETFDQLAEELYDGYYIFKAPHHGTAGSWSHVFGDIYKSHILISNGDYHAAGMVCGEYQREEGIKHCTNPSACSWFVENGYCCNRVAYCWEFSDRGALTLRCPKCTGESERAGCGVYILAYGKDKGCLCDE